MSRILTIRMKPMIEPRVTPIIAPLFKVLSLDTATRPLVGVGDAKDAGSTSFGEWLDPAKALDVEDGESQVGEWIEDENEPEIAGSFEDGNGEGNEERWWNAELIIIRC